MMTNFIVKDSCPVPKGSGKMETENACVTNPLPCIVILIHGVNDIGEAFPNQDKGICEGLNQRLGRSDLIGNKWEMTGTKKDDGKFSPRMSIIKEGYSPIVPFFWGYRPVDKEEYKKDQQAYFDRLEKQKTKDPELPYDSYWQDRDVNIPLDEITIEKLNCDRFGNWIDSNYQRNGGPFSDATSCIPDMYGPGMASILTFSGKIVSPAGAKVYDNPHRIYLAYAAHRLAKLITQIRQDTEGQDIPINIVAHSQGTIITMLANLLLDKQGVLPADCAILTHSPYAFEITLGEQVSKEYALGMQSNAAREQTFVNFVKVMKEGQQNRRKITFKPQFLLEKGVIGCVTKEENYKTEKGESVEYDRLGEDYDLFYRDNFGKVYNYFSPNDHVVSLQNVQGMGWQGIPDDILQRCSDFYLKQRIFSQHYIVGNDTTNKQLKIPLKRYEILAKDYPAGISVEDYKKRSQPTNGYEYGGTSDLVYLTPQQIDLLKNIPPFKQLEGKLLSAFYQFYSGTSVSVWYQPSQAEFLKENPIAKYNTVSNDELDEVCETEESKRLKNDNIFQARMNCGANATHIVSSFTTRYTVTRTITGEKVPEPFRYQVDTPSGKSALSRTVHYNDAYNSGAIKKLEKEIMAYDVDKPDWLPIPDRPMYPLSSNEIGYIPISNKMQLDRLAQENQWDRGVISVKYKTTDTSFTLRGKLTVTRYLTKAELNKKIINLVEKEEDSSSHHSGITMNEFAPKQVMAYDLAIGLVKGICSTDLTLLQKWRHYADWRSPANTDDEAITYMTTGILPEELKVSMNYPEKHMPTTVVNDFYSINYTDLGRIIGFIETLSAKYKLLSTYPKIQYPLPEPDLTTE